MTRFYKEKGFTLARADTSTKVLVTAFLLFVLAGVVIAALQYSSRSGGFGPGSAREWVGGNEDDLDAGEIRAQKGARELLAFTHDHILSLSMVLFVVLHLVQLTPLAPRGKIALTLIGFGGLAGTLGLPWLLRAGSDGAAPLLIGCGVALLATLSIGALVVIGEMWFFARWRLSRGAPEPPPADPMFPTRD